MANISHDGQHPARWLHWLTRGIAFLLAGFWLLIGVVSLVAGDEPRTTESFLMAGFMIMAVILTIVAWRWEKAGGILLIIFGLGFSTFAYFSAGHNQWLAVLISGVPFLIVGILFLANNWRWCFAES